MSALAYRTVMPTNKTPKGKEFTGFSDFERQAMKDRILELKAESERTDGGKLVLKRIASMPEPDRSLAKRIHKIVTTNAPKLVPKTWYGMPAYADKDGKVVIFFQDAKKFQARYASLGFNDTAKLDDGMMWPTAFALKKLTPADEKKIAALVKKAVR